MVKQTANALDLCVLVSGFQAQSIGLAAANALRSAQRSSREGPTLVLTGSRAQGLAWVGMAATRGAWVMSQAGLLSNARQSGTAPALPSPGSRAMRPEVHGSPCPFPDLAASQEGGGRSEREMGGLRGPGSSLATPLGVTMTVGEVVWVGGGAGRGNSVLPFSGEFTQPFGLLLLEEEEEVKSP